jgi:mRNA interferase HicA
LANGAFVIDDTTLVLHRHGMTSAELKRFLAKQDCTFEPGKGGHLIVRLGAKRSVLPMHGSRKGLGAGLVKAILKQLGLK